MKEWQKIFLSCLARPAPRHRLYERELTGIQKRERYHQLLWLPRIPIRLAIDDIGNSTGDKMVFDKCAGGEYT